MGLFSKIKKTVKSVVKNPVGAFLLGGPAGLAALHTYNSIKGAGKQAAQRQGYPQLAQGCCGHFLQHPMSMFGRAGISAFAAVAANAQTHGQLAQLAYAAQNTPAWHHPVGRANLTQILAANQARITFSHLAYSFV